VSEPTRTPFSFSRGSRVQPRAACATGAAQWDVATVEPSHSGCVCLRGSPAGSWTGVQGRAGGRNSGVRLARPQRHPSGTEAPPSHRGLPHRCNDSGVARSAARRPGAVTRRGDPVPATGGWRCLPAAAILVKYSTWNTRTPRRQKQLHGQEGKRRAESESRNDDTRDVSPIMRRLSPRRRRVRHVACRNEGII
jgi:hypothetical protein